MMRKEVFIATVLAALAAAAHAQVLAPEQPPGLDPLEATQEGSRPLVVMRGTISDAGGVEIRETEIVVAPPSSSEQVGHSDRAVLLELLGSDNEVLEALAIDDPRIVHELEGNGETYLVDRADFTATIPLEPDATEVRMQEVEIGTPPGGAGEGGSEQGDMRMTMVPVANSSARVELARALEAFCAENRDEAVCR
ncbi:MAG TPA: hypothetical protein PKA33_14850 [Amaricoccus sp.]|uniref:hypothetical protein n=1 Tax=Amaricoccus sp. TaxID=1872485 RepID=UPI002CEAC3B9|nr:hypothetical protein [Amaricoccus sp.]HMQ94493.1 hypothetical protein [Amaricoccus sp.]HMR53512.1 hypothetical protein [Amaricoccus sp.]HMU00628.1 hypothetical protein [Amaricoccus sp.]